MFTRRLWRSERRSRADKSLAQRAQDCEEQKETRAPGVEAHPFRSLGFLFLLGIIENRSLWILVHDISSEVEALTLAEPDVVEDLDWLVTR